MGDNVKDFMKNVKLFQIEKLLNENVLFYYQKKINEKYIKNITFFKILKRYYNTESFKCTIKHV